MKLRKPNKIAICLNAPDLDRALEQKQALISIEDTFDVEWDFRAKRFSGPYVSFSQMINESIISTESEFMIFINPKSEVEPNDVHVIIEDLCSGYALSNVIAFGLWGCTKQLFREVGLFDERLIGSEYEDDDFLIRILEYDKAVNWRLERWRYDPPAGTPTIQNYFKGIAANIFREKWIFNKDLKTISKNKEYLEEKRVPKLIMKHAKKEISSSWMSFKESKHVNDGIFLKYVDFKISRPIEFKKSLNNLTIYVNEQDDEVCLGLVSVYPTNLTMVISRVTLDNNFLVIPRMTYHKDTQYRFNKQVFFEGAYYNITAWHKNYIVYNHTFKYNNSVNIRETFNLIDSIPLTN